MPGCLTELCTIVEPKAPLRIVKCTQVSIGYKYGEAQCGPRCMAVVESRFCCLMACCCPLITGWPQQPLVQMNHSPTTSLFTATAACHIKLLTPLFVLSTLVPTSLEPMAYRDVIKHPSPTMRDEHQALQPSSSTSLYLWPPCTMLSICSIFVLKP